MISKDEVMDLLLEACPSYAAKWQEYTSDACYDADLLYLHLGEFAHHLVELLQGSRSEEFPAVCEVIERLHVDGDSYVKEAATIGLLEGIQSVAGWKGVDLDQFVPFLGAETREWWHRLNDFWDGKRKAL